MSLRIRTNLIFAWCIGSLSVNCFADSLAPNSLLCEKADVLVFATHSSDFAGKNADEVLRAAGLGLQLISLQKNFADIQRSQANREATIAGRRYAQGADADAKTAEAAADRAEVRRKDLQSILDGCASSGATAVPAQVLESRPISGIARIKVDFKGSPAELFTQTSSLGK